jgi:1-acyl-sn-glycerol-3-phosphate acyltransferase
MPYRAIIGVAKSWGRLNLVLLRAVAGIDCEVRGRDKIPKGPLIVASKHQSAWETFALLPLLENPVFILKRELQWIPIFGWLTIKGRMVPVHRGGGSQALLDMIERARTEPDNRGSSFSEQTRRPPEPRLAANRRRHSAEQRAYLFLKWRPTPAPVRRALVVHVPERWWRNYGPFRRGRR